MAAFRPHMLALCPPGAAQPPAGLFTQSRAAAAALLAARPRQLSRSLHALAHDAGLAGLAVTRLDSSQAASPAWLLAGRLRRAASPLPLYARRGAGSAPRASTSQQDMAAAFTPSAMAAAAHEAASLVQAAARGGAPNREALRATAASGWVRGLTASVDEARRLVHRYGDAPALFLALQTLCPAGVCAPSPTPGAVGFEAPRPGQPPRFPRDVSHNPRVLRAARLANRVLEGIVDVGMAAGWVAHDETGHPLRGRGGGGGAAGGARRPPNAWQVNTAAAAASSKSGSSSSSYCRIAPPPPLPLPPPLSRAPESGWVVHDMAVGNAVYNTPGELAVAYEWGRRLALEGAPGGRLVWEGPSPPAGYVRLVTLLAESLSAASSLCAVPLPQPRGPLFGLLVDHTWLAFEALDGLLQARRSLLSSSALDVPTTLGLPVSPELLRRLLWGYAALRPPSDPQVLALTLNTLLAPNAGLVGGGEAPLSSTALTPAAVVPIPVHAAALPDWSDPAYALSTPAPLASSSSTSSAGAGSGAPRRLPLPTPLAAVALAPPPEPCSLPLDAAPAALTAAGVLLTPPATLDLQSWDNHQLQSLVRCGYKAAAAYLRGGGSAARTADPEELFAVFEAPQETLAPTGQHLNRRHVASGLLNDPVMVPLRGLATAAAKLMHARAVAADAPSPVAALASDPVLAYAAAHGHAAAFARPRAGAAAAVSAIEGGGGGGSTPSPSSPLSSASPLPVATPLSQQPHACPPVEYLAHLFSLTSVAGLMPDQQLLQTTTAVLAAASPASLQALHPSSWAQLIQQLAGMASGVSGVQPSPAFWSALGTTLVEAVATAPQGSTLDVATMPIEDIRFLVACLAFMKGRSPLADVVLSRLLDMTAFYVRKARVVTHSGGSSAGDAAGGGLHGSLSYPQVLRRGNTGGSGRERDAAPPVSVWEASEEGQHPPPPPPAPSSSSSSSSSSSDAPPAPPPTAMTRLFMGHLAYIVWAAGAARVQHPGLAVALETTLTPLIQSTGLRQHLIGMQSFRVAMLLHGLAHSFSGAYGLMAAICDALVTRDRALLDSMTTRPLAMLAGALLHAGIVNVPLCEAMITRFRHAASVSGRAPADKDWATMNFCFSLVVLGVHKLVSPRLRDEFLQMVVRMTWQLEAEEAAKAAAAASAGGGGRRTAASTANTGGLNKYNISQMQTIIAVLDVDAKGVVIPAPPGARRPGASPSAPPPAVVRWSEAASPAFRRAVLERMRDGTYQGSGMEGRLRGYMSRLVAKGYVAPPHWSYLTADGFSLDLAWPEPRVVMDVHGPAHYLPAPCALQHLALQTLLRGREAKAAEAGVSCPEIPAFISEPTMFREGEKPLVEGEGSSTASGGGGGGEEDAAAWLSSSGLWVVMVRGLMQSSRPVAFDLARKRVLEAQGWRVAALPYTTLLSMPIGAGDWSVLDPPPLHSRFTRFIHEVEGGDSTTSSQQQPAAGAVDTARRKQLVARYSSWADDVWYAGRIHSALRPPTLLAFLRKEGVLRGIAGPNADVAALADVEL